MYINGNLVAETDSETLSYINEAEVAASIVYNQFTTAEVVAVYEDGKTSVNIITVVKHIWDSSNIVENSTIKCNIFPNPANDKLYIEAETEVEEVVVYDVYGRHQVTETPSHQGNLTIDLSDLKSGIYFVKINTNEGNIVKRIIKN